jgi:outer membrane protein assembly factor BamB/serine/threonine protein kinase
MQQVRVEYFERYRIERYLGATSWASSYLALDQQDSKLVRLKIMRPYISRDESYVQTFLEKASRIHEEQHPNVIPIVRWGLHEQSLFLVSEYDKNRLPLPTQPNFSSERVVNILAELAQVVAHYASLDITHLGIKPSNIFIDNTNKVWLSDFGIHPLPTPEDNTRHVQLSSKSAAFMAPELRTQRSQQTSVDMYSMGILAYLLCSGSTPFSSIIPEAIFAEQGLERISPLSKSVRSVPEDVDAALLRSIALNPSSRQDTWEELISTFRQLSVIEISGMTNYESDKPKRNRDLQQPSTEASLPMLQCQRCGRMNLHTAYYCESCRGRLHDSHELTHNEAAVIISTETKKQRKKRTLKLGGRVALAGILVGIISVQLGIFDAQVTLSQPTNFALSSDSGPGNWAMHRGSTIRSGAATETYSLPGEIAWTFNTQPLETVGDDESTFLDDEEIPNSPLFATPAVVDGIVYLPTGDSRIVALNADNGELIWEQLTSGPINSPPAVAGEFLYVGLRDSQMLALDRLTGVQQWSFKATNPIFAGPLVYEGLLYIPSVDGILHVVDASTGSLVFQVDLGGATFASPAVNDEVILASTAGNKLIVLDRKTGEQRFAFDLKSPSASTPSILGGKVIVPSHNTALWAVDWTEQQGIWEERWYRLRMQMWVMGILDSIESRTGFLWLSRMTKDRDSALGSPAVSQEKAFYCTIRGKCASVDTSTGEQIWQTDLDEQIFSSPVIAGEAIYFGTNKGNVYALDSTSGQQVWTFQADGKVTADIVPANDMFYIASQGGTLYAFYRRE